jgi:ribonuclease HI
VQCWVDASFKEPDEGGCAYIMFNGAELLVYGLQHSNAILTFHMEAEALHAAVKKATELRIADCVFSTDSSELVFLMNSKEPSSMARGVNEMRLIVSPFHFMINGTEPSKNFISF